MGQQADSGRSADLMHMLTTLYGIQHESQMQPEQLRALRASSAAKEYETSAAPAMGAAEVALKGAQTANQQSQADMTRKYDTPQLHDLMLMHASGMPDSDYYGALTHVPGMEDIGASGMKRISDAEAKRVAERADDEARQHTPPPNPGILSGGTPAAVGSNIGTGISSSIYDMPSTAYNAVGGAADFVGGMLGLPDYTRSARLHPYSAIQQARTKGTDYQSAFYDPNQPEQSLPIPVARK